MYNTEKLSDFSFSRDYTTNMDWDAWLRMADMNGRFVYVPEVLVQHRIHSASATSIGIGARDRQPEDLKIFRRLWPGPAATILARLYSRSYRFNEI
jgi:hypothetical protein